MLDELALYKEMKGVYGTPVGSVDPLNSTAAYFWSQDVRRERIDGF